MATRQQRYEAMYRLAYSNTMSQAHVLRPGRRLLRDVQAGESDDGFGASRGGRPIGRCIDPRVTPQEARLDGRRIRCRHHPP